MIVKHRGYIFAQNANENFYKISNSKRAVSLGASEKMLTEDEAKEAIDKYIERYGDDK